MRPAFASTWHAGTFALLLLGVLLLPVVVVSDYLPSREEIYSAFWWGNGPFPYVDQQIFREKGDIDIAFVGSSHMLHGINTPYVQEELSRKLGRPAVVRSICWGGAGFDAVYFITQDLLQNRKVHLLVCYDDINPEIADAPSDLAAHWFRFGDNAEALAGLPLRFQLSYYFAAVIGMPRNLLDLVRANIPTELISAKKNYDEIIYKAPNPAERLGSISAHLGFGPDPGPTENNAPFVDFRPPTDDLSADVVAYSPETKSLFDFTSQPSRPLALHFAQKFARLAQDHGSKLVLLQVPLFTDRRDTIIKERLFWPDALHADVTMVGIPPATLFNGLSDDDIRKLYYNYAHMNKNGQEFFTPVITPRLLQIYDDAH